MNADHTGAIICEVLWNQELAIEPVIQLIFLGLMLPVALPPLVDCGSISELHQHSAQTGCMDSAFPASDQTHRHKQIGQ